MKILSVSGDSYVSPAQYGALGNQDLQNITQSFGNMKCYPIFGVLTWKIGK